MPSTILKSVFDISVDCNDVNRREGTSKSNSVDARGDFASKLNVAQMYF